MTSPFLRAPRLTATALGIAALTSALSVALLPLGAQVVAPTSPPAAASAASAAMIQGDRSGARLAQNTCLKCHGTGVGPDLRLQQFTYETIHYVTRHGLNAMPSFRESEISDEELHAVADYLASLRVAPGETPGPVPGAVPTPGAH